LPCRFQRFFGGGVCIAHGALRLSILIIDENRIRASIIEEGLREAGHRRVVATHDVNEVGRAIEAAMPTSLGMQQPPVVRRTGTPHPPFGGPLHLRSRHWRARSPRERLEVP
jgi:hypothetical protein